MTARTVAVPNQIPTVRARLERVKRAVLFAVTAADASAGADYAGLEEAVREALADANDDLHFLLRNASTDALDGEAPDDDELHALMSGEAIDDDGGDTDGGIEELGEPA